VCSPQIVPMFPESYNASNDMARARVPPTNPVSPIKPARASLKRYTSDSIRLPRSLARRDYPGPIKFSMVRQ
jgi:hypothetical protein